MTKTKLKNILKKKPITNTNIKVMHTTKSNTKSYKIKSKSNHHNMKSQLLTHNKSNTRLQSKHKNKTKLKQPNI